MSHKPTVDSYNKIAEEFHSRNFATIYAREYRIFRDLIIDGNKVLEIGCGTGRDAEGLINLGFEYIGVDASEGMLKVAENKLPTATFQLGDFYNLNFEDGSFDGFWAAASFLHVPKNDIDKVLQEAKRILKSSGIGFISLKQKRGMDEGVIREEKAGGIERYFAFYEADEFKEILERNNLEVVQIVTQQENDKDSTVWLCYFVRKP